MGLYFDRMPKGCQKAFRVYKKKNWFVFGKHSVYKLHDGHYEEIFLAGYLAKEREIKCQKVSQ